MESEGENTTNIQQLLEQEQNPVMQLLLKQEQDNQANACVWQSASQQSAQASAETKQGPSPNPSTDWYPVNITPLGQTRSGRRIRLLLRYSYAALQFQSDSLSNFSELHPLSTLQSFAANKTKRTKRHDPDTMTLEEAMQEPDREKFIKAMKKELYDHTKRHHWEIVSTKRTKNAKLIPMAWLGYLFPSRFLEYRPPGAYPHLDPQVGNAKYRFHPCLSSSQCQNRHLPEAAKRNFTLRSKIW